MLSGSADGEVIFWDLPGKQARFQIDAHAGMVRGLAFAENHSLAADNIFVSSGDDKKVLIWSV
jgi:WD40 repeat protein